MEKTFKRKLLEFGKDLDILTFVMIGLSFLLFFFMILNMEGTIAFKYGLLITYLIILPVSGVIHFIFTLYPLKEGGGGETKNEDV